MMHMLPYNKIIFSNNLLFLLLSLKLIFIHITMVDRYQSLLENSEVLQRKKNNKSSLLLHKDLTSYQMCIQKTQRSPNILKKYIRQYKMATTSQQQNQVAQCFKEQQANLKRGREELAKHFHSLEKQPEKPQFLFIKEQLLKVVKVQMGLDVEMKEIVQERKEQKERQAKVYTQGSAQLNNAINDLKEKRDQILYLEQSVNQCLQLLQLIGILVFENGKKIDEAFQNVERANVQIAKAEQKIEIAKIRTKRSTNRKCCIIIFGLIAIALALVVLFSVL